MKELVAIKQKVEVEEVARCEAKKEARSKDEALTKTENRFHNFEEELTEANKNNAFLSSQLQRSQENLQKIKLNCMESASTLKKSQHDFRKKEEEKLKMKSSHTQVCCSMLFFFLKFCEHPKKVIAFLNIETNGRK